MKHKKLFFQNLHYLDHKIRKQYLEIEFGLYVKYVFAELSGFENIKQNLDSLPNKTLVIGNIQALVGLSNNDD